ncbi:MAG: tetratricopeptide repeat protein [Salinivirgaceae bacterium]|nr:tetratricopeptide repeat protein [Salinivirgaceae bacterium]
MKNIILLGLLIIASGAFAQQERKYIRQGNRAYNKAIIDSATVDTTMYQNAEVDYRKAIETDPNNWDALYNLGNSLFKQGKFEEATRQFQAVAGMDNDDKNDLALAFHNLGNSFLKTNKLQEAIEAYKDALRNNPSDMETKYNLAWAQDKLKNQEQQEQQNQDQDQNQDDQEKKDQEQKQDQQNQDQQKQEEQKQQQQQQKEQEQEQQQQSEENKNQISKEDAMRILEALQNDEKQVQEKVQKQKVQAKKKTIEKDW